MKFSDRSHAALAPAAIIVALAAANSQTARADVLYDNGPSTYGAGAVAIGPPSSDHFGGRLAMATTPAVGDTFTVPATDVLEGMNFTTWTSPGDQLGEIGWAVFRYQSGFNAFVGEYLQATGVSIAQSSLIETNSQGYDVNAVHIDFPGFIVSAAVPIYTVLLFNGVTGNDAPVFWDVNGGPSHAVSYGPDRQFTVLGASESFQILGSPYLVPEPASWALMLIGFGAVGAASRRRRAAVA